MVVARQYREIRMKTSLRGSTLCGSGLRGTRRRHGSTIVEFAMVVPVLLALMIGIMEFGWLVYGNLVLSNITRESARSASLGNPRAQILSGITTRTAPMQTTATISYSTNQGTTYTPVTTDAAYNAIPSGALVRIEVRARHRALTGFLPMLRNRYITIQASFGRE
jgi:Flp pilus assembly protein TadG